MADSTITLDKILARVDNLPTLPLVALKVGELVNDPRAGAKDIANVMHDDPGLSSKVLRLVNSAYYAIPGGVSDVERAISFVGFNTLHQLVLSVSVLEALKTPEGTSYEARDLWLHSLAVGTCAEVLGRRIGYKDPGTCFTAGLLHDVGKIALAITEPDRFLGALHKARSTGHPMHVAETDAGLPSHDRVGSRLARKWKFPAPLLLPIERHHRTDDPDLRNTVATDLIAVIDIVAVADEICRVYGIGDGGSPPPERLRAESLESIGLSRLHVEDIHTELMRRLEQSKVFLKLIG